MLAGTADGLVGGRRAQPQRGRRLHHLVARGQQLGRQRVQVDLVAEQGAEPLGGPNRVVLAPVEAEVDRLLDATAGRLEQGGHGQGRPGHRPARRPGPDPLPSPASCSAAPRNSR
jgi:hypothetical protein